MYGRHCCSRQAAIVIVFIIIVSLGVVQDQGSTQLLHFGQYSVHEVMNLNSLHFSP